MSGPTPRELLGSILERHREEQGRTKADVAAHCGVHPSQWGRIESGQSETTVQVLFRALGLLGIDLEELRPVIEATGLHVPRWMLERQDGAEDPR